MGSRHIEFYCFSNQIEAHNNIAFRRSSSNCLLLNFVLIVNRNLFLHYFIFHCKRNGIQLSTTFLYLKPNVLYWPDDDRLRSKHVATVNPIAYIISLY